MKTGTILLEVAAIIGLAAGAGTAYHLGIQAPEKRIEFIKSYPNPFTPMQQSEQGAPERKAEPKVVEPKAKPKTVEPKIEPKVVEPPVEPKVQPKDPPPPPPTPPPLGKASGEISLDEGKAEFDAGTPFLDARRTRDFQKGRIQGARSLSVWEPGNDARIAEMEKDVPREIPVVVYCTGGNCEDSHNLAKDLENFGYKEIRILKGGYTEWEKRGYPVEKGSAEGGAEEGEEEGK